MYTPMQLKVHMYVEILTPRARHAAAPMLPSTYNESKFCFNSILLCTIFRSVTKDNMGVNLAARNNLILCGTFLVRKMTN
jgi:hypothetical protein